MSILYATEAVGYIVASVSVLSASTLTYAAYFNSPREMGTYKWYIFIESTELFKTFRYIIANAVCGAGWEVFSVTSRFEPLFPAPVLLAGGMLRSFIVPDWLYLVGVNAGFMCLAGEISSILAMFVYRCVDFFLCLGCQYCGLFRYCQSASGDVLFGLLRPQQLLVSAVMLIGVVDLVGLAGLNMIVVSPTSTKSLLEKHPDLLQVVYNRTLISFRV